jgi:uncharacterized membrane protein YciS (DUF1049 family)
MADKKEKKVKLTPEEKQKEKERLARIKKEEKELKQKAKEKAQRIRDKERKIRQKELEEERRIRRIVNFPFKLLLYMTTFVTLVTFIMMYFGGRVYILDSLYNAMILFIFAFFLVGVIIVAHYYMQSEVKLVEIENRRKKEKEEEKERLRREEAELDALLREEMDEIEGKSPSKSSDSNLLEQEPSLMDFDDFEMPESDDFENDSGEDFASEFDKELSDFEESEGLTPSNEEPAEDNETPLLDEPEPFFSEDDFMNDVVFGSNEEQST